MTLTALPRARTRTIGTLVIVVALLAAIFAVSPFAASPAVAPEVWSYPLPTALVGWSLLYIGLGIGLRRQASG